MAAYTAKTIARTATNSVIVSGFAASVKAVATNIDASMMKRAAESSASTVLCFHDIPSRTGR